MSMRSRRFTLSAVIIFVFFASAVIAVMPSRAIASASCPKQSNTGSIKVVVVPRSVSLGQEVRFQIENPRGPAVAYGAEFSIQQCVDGIWMLAPFSPEVFTKQRIEQPAGKKGPWSRVQIPTDAASGAYRIRKSVWDGERWRSLAGEFRVSA